MTNESAISLAHDQSQVWQVGQYTVEMLQLGRFRMDGGGMFGVVPKTLWQRMYPHCDDRNRLELIAQAMLVRGPGLVLVADAGLGDKLNSKVLDIFDVQQPNRALPQALAQRGVAVEDVTHFVFTHMHFDHAGGATEMGPDGRLRPVFPKAIHYVQASQLGWANNPSDKDKASFDPQNWEAIVDAGLMRELEGGQGLAPGIELRVLHGHTTGMQMVLVTAAADVPRTTAPVRIAQGLLYSVDLFPTATHLKPHYIPAFDNHPLASLEEKRVYLEELEARKIRLAFGHDPFTGPSLITRNGRGEIILQD